MKKPDVNAKDDWGDVADAAAALGIDISTLPSRQGLESRRNEHEGVPEPEPDLSIKPLTRAQLRLLLKALPPKQKFLTRIPAEEFLQACVCAAAADFKWSIMPTGEWSVIAFRHKFQRMCLAGQLAPLVQKVRGSPLFDERLKALFGKLGEREVWYQRRVEQFRVARRRKVARSDSFTRARG